MGTPAKVVNWLAAAVRELQIQVKTLEATLVSQGCSHPITIALADHIDFPRRSVTRSKKLEVTNATIDISTITLESDSIDDAITLDNADGLDNVNGADNAFAGNADALDHTVANVEESFKVLQAICRLVLKDCNSSDELETVVEPSGIEDFIMSLEGCSKPSEESNTVGNLAANNIIRGTQQSALWNADTVMKLSKSDARQHVRSMASAMKAKLPAGTLCKSQISISDPWEGIIQPQELHVRLEKYIAEGINIGKFFPE